MAGKLSLFPLWLAWLALSLHVFVSSVLFSVSSLSYARGFWEKRLEPSIAARVPEAVVFSLVFCLIQTLNGWADLMVHLITQIPLVQRVHIIVDVTSIFTHLFFAELFCTMILRLICRYRIGRFRMEQTWRYQLEMQKSKPLSFILLPFFDRWERLLILTLSLCIVLISCIFFIDGLMFNMRFHMIWIISVEGLISAKIIAVSFIAWRCTGFISAKNGPRSDLVWMALGSLLWFLCGLLSLSLRFQSFESLLSIHLRNSVFLFGYYWLVMRRPIKLLHKSELPLTMDHPALPSLRRSISSERENQKLNRVLAAYESFVLFTQHSVSEFSSEGILFIVWFMRTKQAMFDLLKSLSLLEPGCSQLNSLGEAKKLNLQRSKSSSFERGRSASVSSADGDEDSSPSSTLSIGLGSSHSSKVVFFSPSLQFTSFFDRLTQQNHSSASVLASSQRMSRVSSESSSSRRMSLHFLKRHAKLNSKNTKSDSSSDNIFYNSEESTTSRSLKSKKKKPFRRPVSTEDSKEIGDILADPQAYSAGDPSPQSRLSLKPSSSSNTLPLRMTVSLAKPSETFESDTVPSLDPRKSSDYWSSHRGSKMSHLALPSDHNREIDDSNRLPKRVPSLLGMALEISDEPLPENAELEFAVSDSRNISDEGSETEEMKHEPSPPKMTVLDVLGAAKFDGEKPEMNSVKSPPVRPLFNTGTHSPIFEPFTLRDFGRIVRLPSKVMRPGSSLWTQRSSWSSAANADEESDDAVLREISDLLLRLLDEFVEMDGIHSVNVSDLARNSALKYRHRIEIVMGDGRRMKHSADDRKHNLSDDNDNDCDNDCLFGDVVIETVAKSYTLNQKVRMLLRCMRCLDSVMDEVLRVLKGDTFRRFVVSPQFCEWFHSNKASMSGL